MKRIMIDLDDVITEGGFLALINEYTNKDYKKEDFKYYLMQDILPDKEEFFKFFLTKNMYAKTELLPNVYEVIKELNDKYEVYICSAFVIPEIPNESAFTVPHKCDYLLKNLDFLNPRQFIFADNKEIINCDIKIDDKLGNLKNAETLILFQSYHNTHYSDAELKELNIVKVNNWLEIKKLLLD